MKPSPEDQMLYVVRFMQFMNICTVHQDFLSGHYQPSTAGMKVPDDEVDVRILAEMGNTLMFQMYAFFYSLVEGRSKTDDAFRVRREKYPKEQEAIDAMYALVQPVLSELRDFPIRWASMAVVITQSSKRALSSLANTSRSHNC